MKKKLVFLTGAGISAESGIPTFRDAVTGLWENASIEEVCVAGCLERNEERAYRFYAELHDKYKDCKPNQLHPWRSFTWRTEQGQSLRQSESLMGLG